MIKNVTEIPGSEESLGPGKTAVFHNEKSSLSAELLAAFGTTASQNLATIFSSHTSTEAVVTLALENAGLKCTFHDCCPQTEVMDLESAILVNFFDQSNDFSS